MYLADETLVADSLFCKLCRIKSDLLLTGVDNMCDLQIKHEVQLEKYTINVIRTF